LKTLKELAEDSIETLESGYYREARDKRAESLRTQSLVDAIRSHGGGAIISEIKFASPSAGQISDRREEVSTIVTKMIAGGAAGISVLTEPRNFNGSISHFVEARKSTQLPLIMKDVVVSSEQIVAASNLGANAILLMEELFWHGYAKNAMSLNDAVKVGRIQGLDVIVQAHTKEGIKRAFETGCDVLGIINSDLRTYETSIDTTIDLLEILHLHGRSKKLVLSESGFEEPDDLSHLIKNLALRNLPTPDAFLIGTAVMRARNIQGKVRGFVEAGRA
jgi:indole-3-glycerol phosphate synthase